MNQMNVEYRNANEDMPQKHLANKRRHNLPLHTKNKKDEKKSTITFPEPSVSLVLREE